jgi:Bacterial Ig domain/SprB repeat
LNVSGGTLGYTYNWSNGSTLQDPSGLVVGAYTVTVTDAANCNAIISTSITQPSAIQRSLSAFDETCNLNDGAVYATVSGGVAPYTFAWSNSATTQNLENIAGGTYSVTITDANSCTATSSAIVGVPICIPPVAVDDYYNALINTTVTGTVASNDTDGDNTTAELTFLPLTSPTTAQGVIEWDPSYNGAFVFTPTAGFTGTVTIQYQVCDPLDLCDIGILSIYIGDTNDPPVAVFNTTTTNEDTPININILANDTDSDGNIDPTTVTITNQPDHGTVSVNPTTGELTYTPTSNYYGPDTLIYQVCDDGTPLPAQCDTAIVYIVVAPTPDITASATQTCNDNGTAAITTDDYFTIELTATNPAPGGSNQYQVYNGADLLATGTYGSSVTLNWRNAANTLRFLADGTAIYSLTIRDADNSIDETILTTTPEAECSDCPPPICPPVILTKIPMGAN